jgi:hypothetical protein
MPGEKEPARAPGSRLAPPALLAVMATSNNDKQRETKVLVASAALSRAVSGARIRDTDQQRLLLSSAQRRQRRLLETKDQLHVGSHEQFHIDR